MGPAFIRYGLMSVVLFALLMILLQFRIHLRPILAYGVAINLVGFVMYALDKMLAKQGWLRVPEILLHILVLLGATPAGILAQQLFWHKTTKRSFQIAFWSIAFFQVVVVYVIIYTDFLQMIF